MKTVAWLAWILFGLEALFVLWLYVVRHMGDDAAGRGMARGFALVLAPILLGAGALLWWGRQASARPAFWIAFAIVSLPVLLWIASSLRGGFRTLELAWGRAQDGRFDEPILFSSYAMRPKLEALARHGADFRRLHTRSDRLGWTTAMNAADVGDWDLVEFFLDHAVPVAHVAPDGRSLRTVVEEWAARERDAGGAPEADPGYRLLAERLHGPPRP